MAQCRIGPFLTHIMITMAGIVLDRVINAVADAGIENVARVSRRPPPAVGRRMLGTAPNNTIAINMVVVAHPGVNAELRRNANNDTGIVGIITTVLHEDEEIIVIAKDVLPTIIQVSFERDGKI